MNDELHTLKTVEIFEGDYIFIKTIKRELKFKTFAETVEYIMNFLYEESVMNS